MFKFIPLRHIRKSTLKIDREKFNMPYTILYFARCFGHAIKVENETIILKNGIIFEITFVDPISKVRESILVPFRIQCKNFTEEYDTIYIDNDNMIKFRKDDIDITLQYKNRTYNFHIVLSEVGYRKKCDMVDTFEFI